MRAVEALSIKEKVGQLVVASIDGMELNDAAKGFIIRNAIGGIVHFGNNVKDPAQARSLNDALQQHITERCGIPALISIDHEGGRVMRFREGVTAFPPAMAVAETGDEKLAQAGGRAMGEELLSLGFHMNFAPVLDVNTNRKNPVIGTRAYGETPQDAARFGIAAMRGMQSAGLYACGKHFPGHGDTANDSHFSLPVVDKPIEELMRVELYPFAEAIRAGISAIMTSHILYPALEPDGLPATMSRRVLTGLLRETMGFSGLIITDAVHMEAIRKYFGAERGCIEAINAGADLVCIGTGGPGFMEAQERCCRALVAAAESGEIPMERLDGAVSRVLAMKERVTQKAAGDVDFTKNAALAREIAGRGVRWLRGGPPGDTGRVCFVSAEGPPLRYGLSEGDWRAESFARMAGALWRGTAANSVREADTVIVGMPRVEAGSAEMACLREAIGAGKRVLAVLTGVPYGAEKLPDGCATACIFGLTRVGVEALLSRFG